MMARSGGFNVPADFFKERGMPAPVPATPLEGGSRRRWGSTRASRGRRRDRHRGRHLRQELEQHRLAEPGATSGAQSLAAPEPRADAARPTPPATAPKVEAKHVLVATDPLDAHVFQDGQDLGSGPLDVDVPVGQELKIEVRRDGYEPQTWWSTARRPKVKVKLVGAAPQGQPGGKPGRQARARARRQARAGSSAVARRRRDRQSLGQVGSVRPAPARRR